MLQFEFIEICSYLIFARMVFHQIISYDKLFSNKSERHHQRNFIKNARISQLIFNDSFNDGIISLWNKIVLLIFNLKPFSIFIELVIEENSKILLVEKNMQNKQREMHN